MLKYADGLNSRITAEQVKAWDNGSVAAWAWESHQAGVKCTYAGVPVQEAPVKCLS